jgi:hypothetical protein
LADDVAIGVADREQRAAIIGEWLQTEARYLGLNHPAACAKR